MQVFVFDSVFLPSLQGRGYTGVQRYAKVMTINAGLFLLFV